MSEKQQTRRSFLKAAGAATVAGLTASLARSQFAEPPDDIEPALTNAPRLSDAVAPKLLSAPDALFRPTASGCVVQWESRSSLNARVLAGSNPNHLNLVHEGVAAGRVEVAINTSRPRSELYVQCQFRQRRSDAWLSRPLRTVRTTRPPGETYKVAFIADSHVYSAPLVPQRMRNVVQTNAAVIADRPDFAVFLGDEAGVYFLLDRPGYMSQQRALKRWEFWRQAFSPLLASIPSFMVLGNHEGEAGFYQSHRVARSVAYYQRWGTIARKRYMLNPLPHTYAEGGENEGWFGDNTSPATGGAANGNCSPLQNYYAWTWGDALFAVIDVHRYTNIGGHTPTAVDQWTLGAAQLRWLENVLVTSKARWKIVIAHHLVGGYAWDLEGRTRRPNYVYGRGGGRYALVGEQRRVTEIMKRAGAQFFLYGHDHVFAHQPAEDIHFVCCGRPSFLQQRWWRTPGWREAYGDVEARKPHDFYAAIGYVRLTISPKCLKLEYIRTGMDPAHAENVTQREGEVVYGFSVNA